MQDVVPRQNKAVYLFLSIVSSLIFASCTIQKIDREEVLSRNNLKIREFDPFASLSLGNGNFAFTTDITGLQTFPEDYEDGVSLGTMSNWGWHSYPNTENYSFEETHSFYEVEGRQIPYRDQLRDNARASAAATYLRSNPHRLHLGIVGLDLKFEDGRKAEITDIRDINHQLDLYQGRITSDFIFDKEAVHVEAFVHQDKDVISAKVTSKLIERGQLSITLRFPRAVDSHMGSAIDFDRKEAHQSRVVETISKAVLVERILDSTVYFVSVSSELPITFKQTMEHEFIFRTEKSDEMIFSVEFTEDVESIEKLTFAESAESSQKEFAEFWNFGGFVDFGECRDSRAKELERRVVLSQYLTKIQSTGDLPPAETGLTANSWYGKFHLEMTWWHIAHFSQWNRGELIDRQLEHYFDMFKKAKATAIDQGYKGVRWQKMLANDGENAPSRIGSFLIWQQPHIIWFVEQKYRSNPSQDVLQKYAELVEETANFMADFVIKNHETGKYDLPPPLIPAQEHWDRMETKNPPFELAYWYWGLSKAQEWRSRLNLPIDEAWEEIRTNLADLDTANGLYLGIEGETNSYDSIKLMKDHPMVLGSYGILPASVKIDTAIMANTLNKINQEWDWPHTWGWDYPMSAMTAIRLKKPELALELLLKDTPKNRYHANGHNYQTPNIKLYLPGNGGLLYTISMMCAGWDGEEISNIGFPRDGNWNVRWEDLKPVF